LLFAMQTRVY